MRHNRFRFRVYASLLLCCFVLLTGMAACEGKEKQLTLSDPHRLDVSVPGDLPEWLEVFRSEMEQGYAVFNASGYGIFNREAVENFFLMEPGDRASWLGVIAFGEEGEPYLYKIRGMKGAYTVSMDATRDPYGDQGIKTYTYEHAGVLPGKVEGQLCVLYNGGMPDLDNPEDWLPEKAMPIVNLREEQP